MRDDYRTIRPEDGYSAGYRRIEASIETSRAPIVATLNAMGEREATRKGWEIVGKWDEEQHGPSGSLKVRTFWCRTEPVEIMKAVA